MVFTRFWDKAWFIVVIGRREKGDGRMETGERGQAWLIGRGRTEKGDGRMETDGGYVDAATSEACLSVAGQ